MKNAEHTTENTLDRLTAPLLAWYRRSARDLPWRRTDDPYRIWVSEIMLQQTRVAAVLGYYKRFLEAFPSVEALAAADEDALFKLWEGLGYYSRARNLQKTARIVTEQYGGQFPPSCEALRGLPGIGDYTSAAIAAAAFGLPEAAVNGNVLRIYTRIMDCRDDIGSLKTKQMVRAALTAILPADPDDLHIFNQATMELGAIVCVPNGPPKCELCPAADFCLGRIRGTAEALPVKAPKKPRQIEEKTVYVLARPDGAIALRKRGAEGLLSGLWEFPNVPGTLQEDSAAAPLEAWGLTAVAWRKKLTAKHIFTHREWHMTGYVLTVTGDGPTDFLWADKAAFSRLALPSAFAKYTAEAKALLSVPDDQT